MKLQNVNRSHVRPWWLAVAWLCCVPAMSCLATPVVISSSATTMQSTADRMISYRHQNHMWQTSDGAYHVMINRGTQPQGNSLQLFSSYDGGATWVGGVTLSRSGVYSTSDGYLVGDTLSVTYQTPSGAVMFAVLQYNVTSESWTLVNSEIAFTSSTLLAINPAMATDALGTIWLAFVSNEIATGNYNIKLIRKSTAAEGWVDTGLIFGSTDNLSIERSARPVVTANGIGMVYTLHQYIYWASRSNQWAYTQPWTNQLIFTSTANDNDPYASHFSLAVDAQQNIHMVTVDGGRLLYFRFLNKVRSWTSRYLTNDNNSSYVQVTMAQGNLVVASNFQTQIRVLQSSDTGNTFTYTQQLVHPTATTGVSYSNPRIETPTNSVSPVPLLQQYVDNGTQRLLFFRFPVAP